MGTKDGRVCFHRRPFANAVKPQRCTTEPVNPLDGINKDVSGAKLLLMTTCSNFRGFRGIPLPHEINPPQLIFLPILPHRCIQCVIKFSVDIDHDIKINVSSLLLGDHESRHEKSCLLPVTSYCSYYLST